MKPGIRGHAELRFKEALQRQAGILASKCRSEVHLVCGRVRNLGIDITWITDRIAVGGGLGLIRALIVGIVGAALAGYTLPLLGFYAGGGMIAAIVNAVIGAVVFLAIVRLCKLMLQPEKT